MRARPTGGGRAPCRRPGISPGPRWPKAVWQSACGDIRQSLPQLEPAGLPHIHPAILPARPAPSHPVPSRMAGCAVLRGVPPGRIDGIAAAPTTWPSAWRRRRDGYRNDRLLGRETCKPRNERPDGLHSGGIRSRLQAPDITAARYEWFIAGTARTMPAITARMTAITSPRERGLLSGLMSVICHSCLAKTCAFEKTTAKPFQLSGLQAKYFDCTDMCCISADPVFTAAPANPFSHLNDRS